MTKSSMLFECGLLPPPMSTSRSPDVIHVIGVPRPSLLITALPYYTEHKPNSKKWGRPGNGAAGKLPLGIYFSCLSSGVPTLHTDSSPPLAFTCFTISK